MEKRRTNNVRSFASPGKYVQGPGLLKELKHFTDAYGNRLQIIIDGFLFDEYQPKLKALYPDDYTVLINENAGEITVRSVEKFADALKEANQEVDLFVGIGGGKTIDTVKILAYQMNKPVVIIPTIASTDAPTSGLSVVYKESGEHSHEVWLQSNPALVLVDTEIIADAPARFLVAGMGDALATYFEAQANEKNNHNNVVSEELKYSLGPTLAAKEIAKLCYQVLLRDGKKARYAVQNGVVTTALENVVEANTLLSGIGFESTGTAAAHAINDGLTALPECVNYYHGERVAFGVLCELVMENADKERLQEVYAFSHSVGLPITLKEVGVDAITDEQLDKVAEAAYNNVIHAEPFVVTRDLIKSAIIVADSIGQQFHDTQKI